MTRVALRTGGIILAAVFLFGCARSPEARRDQYMLKGKQLLKKQDFSRALLEFRNAAQVKSDDPEIYYQMGLAFSGARDFRAAYQAFRKAVTLRPNYAAAQLRIAQLELASGDDGLAKEANALLKTLVENQPASVEMLNTLAFSELKLGNTDSAVQTFERALAQSPGELVSTVMLARAKLSQKDPRAAEEILKKACADAPKSVHARRILGEFYIVQNRAAEAEAEFRKAAALDPKSGAALMGLARLELAAGRKQEAETRFKQLSALEGYKTVYAIFLYKQGRRDEAVREFERLVKEDPDDREARTDLIVAYRLTNRGTEADKLLDKVLKKNPRDVDALLQRGEILLEKARFEEAEADLNRVLKLKPNAAAVHYQIARLHQLRGETGRYKESLFKALDLDPSQMVVRLELAGVLIAANQAKTALDILDKAPEFQRTSLAFRQQRNWALWVAGNLQDMRKGIDAGLAQARLPELLIQDGLWKLQAGNAAGASAALEEALKINPGDIRGLSALRQSYVMQRQSALAVQKVKEYALRQPHSAPLQEFLGFTMWGSGNRAGARAAFGAAKAADPKFYAADFALVQLDAMDSNWDAAATRLNEILSSSPGNTKAHLWLGNVETIRGNSKAALGHFRKVVQAEPDNPQALNNFAYLLADEPNSLDEALKYAQRAKELAPSNATFADTLGWILCRKGLYSSAIMHLERAAAGQDAVSKYHLAIAYARNGNLERGRAVYQAAQKRNANIPEAKIAASEVFRSK